MNKTMQTPFVRDGLELAMAPHDTNWAVWSIPTTNAVYHHVFTHSN